MALRHRSSVLRSSSLDRTYRDVEVDRAHPLASALAELRRTANFGRVLLRGLTADEVQRMLGAVAMGRPLLYLGRAAEALAAAPEAAPLTGAVEGPGTGVLRGLYLAHLGRHAEARAVMDLLVKGEVAGPQLGGGNLVVLTRWLETATLLGDRDTASALRLRLAGSAHLAGSGSEVTCIGRHLGAAAVLLGDREAARRCYEQALAVAIKVRFRPEIALIRLQMAELLLEEADQVAAGVPSPTPQGDHAGSPLPDAAPRTEADLRRQANEHLDFAIAQFRAMKMGPSLERALRHKGLLKA